MYNDLIRLYHDFLVLYGVKDLSPEERQEWQAGTVKMPDEIARILVKGNLSELTEEQVIEFYRHMGVKNMLMDSRLSVKVWEMAAFLRVIPQGIHSAVEFGCGLGFSSVFAAKNLRWSITALDANKEFLDHCSGLAAQEQVDVRIVRASARQSGLPTKSYDLAYCFNLLDCNDRWLEIVKEMHRVSRNVVAMYCLTSRYRRIDPKDLISSVAGTDKHCFTYYFDRLPGLNDAALVAVRIDS